MPRGSFRGRVVGLVASVAVVGAFIAVLRVMPAVTTRAAVPVLLLSVLVVARTWGAGPGLMAAVIVTIEYSYYFLPRVVPGAGLGSGQLWVAFLTFMVSAVLVGELAALAERRRLHAEAGQREIERLYGELEAAFERASEAEAARRNEQLKAALLDALTHNLRTPLTSIKAAVTALMGAGEWNAAARLSIDGRRDLLEVIDEESDRLNRFIEGLSAADKPDPSQPLRFGPVPLDAIVRAGLVRAATVTRHHRVHVAVDDTIPPLAVDAAAIVEVIYILLDNASKYSPEGTEIRLTASRQSDHYARIEVADEGPGIPVALWERVFDKFFRIQGREPVDPHRAGIGLGLSIARRLVEAQAGRIVIEGPSSSGGTVVVVTVPISTEAPTAEPVAASAAASSQR